MRWVIVSLIVLVVLSGCVQQEQRIFDASEDCSADGTECVSLFHNGSFSKYVRVGDVQEGEVFESFGSGKICAPGLTAAVWKMKASDGAGCAQPRCPCHICVKCPDGICGEGENDCICPEDCS
jgi:hypothetical protein